MVAGLFIDFDSDGFDVGAYDDCTADLISAQYRRGGSAEITGVALPGSGTFVLRNRDGRYDPGNASGPLYGKLRDGVPVWFGINTDGTFAGRIVDITVVPSAGTTDPSTVEIVCEDALGWYGRVPVEMTDECADASLYTDTTCVGLANAAGDIFAGRAIQHVSGDSEAFRWGDAGFLVDCDASSFSGVRTDFELLIDAGASRSIDEVHLYRPGVGTGGYITGLTLATADTGSSSQTGTANYSPGGDIAQYSVSATTSAAFTGRAPDDTDVVDGSLYRTSWSFPRVTARFFRLTVATTGNTAVMGYSRLVGRDSRAG